MSFSEDSTVVVLMGIYQECPGDELAIVIVGALKSFGVGIVWMCKFKFDSTSSGSIELLFKHHSAVVMSSCDISAENFADSTNKACCNSSLAEFRLWCATCCCIVGLNPDCIAVVRIGSLDFDVNFSCICPHSLRILCV